MFIAVYLIIGLCVLAYVLSVIQNRGVWSGNVLYFFLGENQIFKLMRSGDEVMNLAILTCWVFIVIFWPYVAYIINTKHI